MALGKEYLKKIKNLCRVPDGGHSAKTDASGRRDPSSHICRGPICRGLGPRQRFILPRAVCLPRARPSVKASLPRAYLCRGLLGMALGKDSLCRVPEIWPSAKPKALGKEAVSSSVGARKPRTAGADVFNWRRYRLGLKGIEM